MAEFWKVDNPDQISDRLKYFESYLRTSWDWTKPVMWKVSVWSGKRSLNANALLHIWFREIGEYFTARRATLSEDDAKYLMKNLFLGKIDIVIGKTVIEDQLRKTSSLTSGEMKFFMDQIVEWCADKGCSLSMPEDSEYMKWRSESGL